MSIYELLPLIEDEPHCLEDREALIRCAKAVYRKNYLPKLLSPLDPTLESEATIFGVRLDWDDFDKKVRVIQ